MEIKYSSWHCLLAHWNGICATYFLSSYYGVLITGRGILGQTCEQHIMVSYSASILLFGIWRLASFYLCVHYLFYTTRDGVPFASKH